MAATNNFEASLLWKKKMNHVFSLYDSMNDNTGCIGIKECEQIAQRLVDYALKAKPNLDRVALSKTFNDIFVESYWKKLNCGGDETLFDKQVKIKDIITNYQVLVNPAFAETWKQIMIKAARICFDVVDTNSNGEISKKEFADYIEMHCPPAINDAEIAFKALDTNHDGVLSREEFANGFVDFWMGEKAGGPGEMFYGQPLEL